MQRIFLVTNIPTPYRLPLYNEVARQLGRHGFVLKVLFGASGYARREWKVDWDSVNFDYEILAGHVFNVGAHEAYTFLYPGLLRRIRREKPAAVIVGGYSSATIVLRLSKIWTGTPFIIWSGETRPQSPLRTRLRRWLVRGASGFIAYGTMAQRYLESLGAGSGQIAIAINTVDTAYFGSHGQTRLVSSERDQYRLVCVSGLFKRKQIDSIVRVAESLSRKRRDFKLQIIGNGPERQNLEELARELNVEGIIEFSGFLQREGVADALRRASCFLFPTSFDIWGLVLVEAMAAGAPCISSIHAGATADLIEDGRTGYAVDFTDTEAVCARIEAILDNPDHARAMGAAAHELVARRLSLAASAEGFVTAVKQVLRARSLHTARAPAG